MFQFPDAMSTDDFLDGYWQKTPLFMPQAWPASLPELSADELGWLATLEDVESRIIFLERSGDTTSYRLEHGPFDEKVLTALPAKDWTLLVQDVEKHLPDFRRLIQEASFIPDWRIDDLMVSFATPGGSVGPHRDNYDVFLCQGDGQREWRIAPENANLKTAESGDLSLVEPFADESPVKADNGDVLYLPPGIAHWGIATESCMTYSIGMRAPTLSEFKAGIARICDTETEYQEGKDLFYTDHDLTENEAKPGLISDLALQRARSRFSTSIELDDADFASVFGSVVTGVKAWLAPEAPSSEEFDSFLNTATQEVSVHGMARLAYCGTPSNEIVFVNGHVTTVNADQLKFFRRLCEHRTAKVGDDRLFRWLVEKGAFDFPTDVPGNAT